jgi:MFS family permease
MSTVRADQTFGTPSAPELAQPTTTTARKRWVTVGVLSTLQSIENSEGGLINSLFPVIRADLGLTLGALGVLTSIGKFARMLLGPLWAMLGDRFGRKLILVATALWGVWMMVAGLAQSYEQLLVLYAIGVLGTVAGEPIANGLVSDIFKPDERGKVYGSMRSLVSLASILVTPLMGQLAGIPGNQGWRIGMFIMGGIGVVGGILTWLLVEDPRTAGGIAVTPTADEPPSLAGKEEGFKFSHVPRLLAIPTVALLAVQLVFITSLVLFAFQVVFLTDVRNYTTQEATIVTSVFFAGFTASSFLGGLAENFGLRRAQTSESEGATDALPTAERPAQQTGPLGYLGLPYRPGPRWRGRQVVRRPSGVPSHRGAGQLERPVRRHLQLPRPGLVREAELRPPKLARAARLHPRRLRQLSGDCVHQRREGGLA